MIEEFIHLILPEIIGLIELIGIFVISFGALKSFYHYIVGIINKRKLSVQMELAISMATGLEFKMAAEILKTVLIRDLEELVILGSIILLRALLTFLIHIELKSDFSGHNQ